MTKPDEQMLKPCPFCGKPAGVMKAHGVFQACCSDSGCPANGTYETRDEAVAVWNTRPGLNINTSALEKLILEKWQALCLTGAITFGDMAKGLAVEIAPYLTPSAPVSDGGWQDISTAPRDGTEFLALLNGLPVKAKYDELGRFIWFAWCDMAQGPGYKCHDGLIEGKRLLEEYQPKEDPKWEITAFIWRSGFEAKPTHWMPLPPPPMISTAGGADD
jgi:hypothetical protein